MLGFKVYSEEDLDRAQAWFARRDLPTSWIERPFQGRTLRTRDNFGVPLEFYHKMDRLPSIHQKYRLYHGVKPLRIDHFNCFAPDVDKAVAFYGRLGFRVTEYTEDDVSKKLWAAWMHRKGGVHDIAFTNGIQACHLEVNPETGFVTLLKHWAVEDCGTVINPQLVDEQIRGGIVQGIGGALFEHCVYDAGGQLINGTMADYLVPMAGEMPDMEIDHVVTMTESSELGAKGAGEAGTAGAPAAVMNALNDALAPLGASVAAQPFTPERILKALGRV